MFEVQAVPWSVDPTIPYGAVFITSSNGLQFIDNNLNSLKDLPILCVGVATAEAARRAGLSDVVAGTEGAAALADLAAALGYHHLLWLAGEPHISISHPDLIFDVKIVYETFELDIDSQVREVTKQPLIALVHSPRAARRFAGLVAERGHIDLVAISEKAALAAGPGWASVHWPDAPSDGAMLEIAAPLCRASETGTSIGWTRKLRRPNPPAQAPYADWSSSRWSVSSLASPRWVGF
jgi:uroporphyrinogen-III synthase